MARESHLWINGLWGRIDEEIYKQHKTKSQVAKACRFDRRTLYGECNISLPYFARLCAEWVIKVFEGLFFLGSFVRVLHVGLS